MLAVALALLALLALGVAELEAELLVEGPVREADLGLDDLGQSLGLVASAAAELALGVVRAGVGLLLGNGWTAQTVESLASLRLLTTSTVLREIPEQHIESYHL